MAGVTRHWNNMSQQSQTGFGVAQPVQFTPKEEAPKKECKETEGYQSLEEALLGEE